MLNRGVTDVIGIEVLGERVMGIGSVGNYVDLVGVAGSIITSSVDNISTVIRSMQLNVPYTFHV